MEWELFFFFSLIWCFPAWRGGVKDRSKHAHLIIYLWEKKVANFVWEPRRTTAQLSVKATPCRITKTGPVIDQQYGPGLKWLKINKTLKLAQFLVIRWKMMLHRVNRYLTCHALLLKTLLQWGQHSVLEIPHRRPFLFFFRLPVYSYRESLVLKALLSL